VVKAALNDHYVLGLSIKWERSAVTNVQFGGTIVLRNERFRQIDTFKPGKTKFTECTETISPTAEKFDDFCGLRPISCAYFIETADEFAYFLSWGFKSRICRFPRIKVA
jgi:hypothetical protein